MGHYNHLPSLKETITFQALCSLSKHMQRNKSGSEEYWILGERWSRMFKWPRQFQKRQIDIKLFSYTLVIKKWNLK